MSSTFKNPLASTGASTHDAWYPTWNTCSDPKRKLACSGSIHGHDPLLTFSKTRPKGKSWTQWGQSTGAITLYSCLAIERGLRHRADNVLRSAALYASRCSFRHGQRLRSVRPNPLKAAKTARQASCSACKSSLSACRRTWRTGVLPEWKGETPTGIKKVFRSGTQFSPGRISHPAFQR
jgi:hypothetical protein